MDDIWADAYQHFDEIDEQKLKEKNNQEEIGCCHELDSEGVCNKCGAEMASYNISAASEWNNYKDTSGNYCTNTQRGDVYDDGNPYSKGGNLAFNTNTLIGKLSLQMTFNHKQKTYWLVGKDFEHSAELLNLNQVVIDTAKNFWHQYMESGKLTRASVRKGLIAACLYHSCINHKLPIEREQIQEVFNCSSKTLSKGEKVLFDVVNNDNLTYKGVQVEDSNSFIKYCSLLKLKFQVSTMCNELYNKYSIELQAVTPKSAVGGIITYIVKNKLKLKIPTKTTISATVDVCTPTINKVISIIDALKTVN